jgi:hypothetical protein
MILYAASSEYYSRISSNGHKLFNVEREIKTIRYCEILNFNIYIHSLKELSPS